MKNHILPLFGMVSLILVMSCSIMDETKKIEYEKRDMPKMPVGGKAVAEELSRICNDESCKNLLNYLNEIYLFKIEYENRGE